MNSNDPFAQPDADAGRRTAQFALGFVTRHHRAVVSAVLVGLAGFGATAFGIAPLAPDAADLPRHIVTQTVLPTGIDSQLEALAGHTLSLYRSDLTRSSDTVDSLLRRLNVDDAAASSFLRSDAVARRLVTGRAGKMVQVRADATGELEELTARFPAENADQLNTHFSRLRIVRDGVEFRATLDVLPMETQLRLGSGVIRNTLFAATDDAHIPDPVAVQMAEIFGADIDFRRELRRGDTFSVLYEAMTADGEPVAWNQASGRVVAAQFVNDGKAFSAVWFKDPAAKSGGYFDLDGHSKRRAFLASPMEFSRVTSGFSMRFHPILQQWRQHAGVDYGAPMGTPVRCVGDGVVEFAGQQNGYGNVVSVKHSADRTTLYAHLSRIDVRRGQHISQGDRIGAVGMTGWATGPHLHFEVKIKGVQQDPMRFAKASEAITISPAGTMQFAVLARDLRGQFEAAAQTAGTGGFSE